VGEEELTPVRRFLKRLSKRIHVERAILFGSRARGDALKDSDYDLVLVSSDFAGMHFLDRIALVLDFWDDDRDLQPLCYTPEEFEAKRQQIGIVRKAVEEGVELVGEG